jgi:bacterioferritin (cytochrome b1)
METVRRIISGVPDDFKNKRADHPKYLNELIASLSVCIEQYKKLANTSDSPELKEIAGKLATERIEFVSVLEENFRIKSKNNYDTLIKIKPMWAKLIKGVTHSKDHRTVMEELLKSELTAIKKLNTYLHYHIPTVDQLDILINKNNAINNAIELFSADSRSYVQSAEVLVPDLT